MRKFFNTAENLSIVKEKDRLRKRAAYKIKRAAIEESCRFELERRSLSSKLAESLAAQVVSKPLEPNKPEFEISLEEIDKKLFLHTTVKFRAS